MEKKSDLIFEDLCDKKATIAELYNQFYKAFDQLRDMKAEIEEIEDEVDGYEKQLIDEGMDDSEAWDNKKYFTEMFRNDVGLDAFSLTSLIEKVEDFFEN